MGRLPEKKNSYYSPKVTWLLVILVGISVIIVGLTILSDENYSSLSENKSTTDQQTQSPEVDSALSSNYPETTDSTETAETPSINWLSHDEGIKTAQDNKRIAMIFFTSTSCLPCEYMQSEILSDSSILSYFDNLIIPVKISSDSRLRMNYQGRTISESNAADVLNIPGYPTVLFYDGIRDEYLFMLPGKISREKFAKTLEYADQRMFENTNLSLRQYLESQGITD